MISIIIVTHGDFGAYMLEAAEMIIGAHSQGVDIISISSRVPVDTIKETLRVAIERHKSDDGMIIFTDIFGGTPTNVSMPLTRDIPNTAVVSGVNLNMVLSAMSYRAKLPFAELVKKVTDDGKKAICDIKGLLAAAQRKAG